MLDQEWTLIPKLIGKWTPVLNEKLLAQHDNRAEAKEYDKQAMKKKLTKKWSCDNRIALFTFYFLANDKYNVINVFLNWQRKIEISLAHGRYGALMKRQKITKILNDEFVKKGLVQKIGTICWEIRRNFNFLKTLHHT